MNLELFNYNLSEFSESKHQNDIFDLFDVQSVQQLKDKYPQSIVDLQNKNLVILKELDNWKPIKSLDEFSEQLVRIIGNLYYKQSVSLFKNNKKLMSNIEANIASAIQTISLRTLVYEFNLLKSEKRDITVQDFIIQYLSTPKNICSIFTRFPVLLDIIHKKVKTSIYYIQDVLEKLNKDKNLLYNLFGFVLNENIYISFSTGDPHLSGKFPIILYSAETKIVYKPRSSHNDFLFNECVNLLRSCSDINNFNFTPQKIINQKNYSWSEFIAPTECKSNKELETFYYSIGCLIPLLYFLDTSDIHLENLIAKGSSPSLIDLECLFNNLDVTLENSDNHKITKILSNSILNIGILPMFNDFFKDDISALGGHHNIFKNYKIPQLFQTIDTLEIKYQENLSERIHAYSNLPSYNSENYNFIKYKEYIYNGFLKSFNLILDNKRSFIQLVERYKDEISIRHLYNSTATYTKILYLSYHPRFLQSPMDRKLFIHSQLSRYDNKVILKEEIEDIIGGDIPYVSSKFTSNTINISNRKKFFNQSRKKYIDLWKKQIQELSVETRNNQLNILKKTFGDQNMKLNNLFLKSPKKQFDSFSIVDTLEAYISDKQIKVNKDISWFATSYEELNTDNNFNIRLKIQAINSNLYSGKLGIVICYYFLSKTLNQTDYEQKYQELFENIIDNFDFQVEAQAGIGMFSGIGGYLYLFSIVDTSSRSKKVEVIKELIYKYILENIENDNTKDIISGTAGVLLYFCNIYKKEKNNEYKKIIDKCTNHLLKTLQSDDRGKYWLSSIKNKEVLGFSHGTTGILYSLSKANNITPIKGWLNLVKDVQKFENYYKDKNSWLDIRESPNNMQNEFYCNGLSGMVIGRSSTENIDKYGNLALSQNLDLTQTEINYDPCLCHGLLGNYWLYKQISDTTNLTEYNTIVTEIEKYFKSLSVNKECMKDNFLDIGLMTGLTGIILGYLSIENNNIPNILLLEI